MLTGISVFTVASLLSSLAPTLTVLLVARAAQGLGAAVMMALAVAFVGETVPKARAGRVMGLLGTMSAIGTTCGPSIGGLLIGGVGWRAIFVVNVLLGVVTLALAFRHLPAPVIAESAPVIRLGLLRDSTLRAGLAMSVLVSTVMMATLVVGPFYLSRALGLAAAAVGFALSVGPSVSALTGVPAGHFVDRLGARPMIFIGLTGIASGAFVVSLLPASVGVLGYLAPLVVMTAGHAVFQAANNTRLMTGVDSDRRGTVGGLLGLSRNLGLILGASAMGAVFAFGAASPDITTAAPSAIAAGMRFTFGIAATLMVGALVLAARTPAITAHSR
jgi:MFS family permease